MRLENKIAMVTGAGSGLGREIALTFAREGAKLAINDIRKDALAAVAEEVCAAGSEALILPTDVSDSVEVRAIFEELVGHFGCLDILVNNAGMVTISDSVRQAVDELVLGGHQGRSLGATRTMSDSQWRRTLSVHLDGTFYCTRAALAIMEPQGRGSIINMASVAGVVGLMAAPDYSAAKAGIIGLTKAVAREAIACGVRVNAIAPGFIDTPLLDALSSTMKQLSLMQTPIGRLGRPSEIAAAALYLASDESSFTVGQVLSPNGGYVI